MVAAAGNRVGVIDTDIQSPGIHVLFNFDQQQAAHSLNDFLYKRCSIEKAAYDMRNGQALSAISMRRPTNAHACS